MTQAFNPPISGCSCRDRHRGAPALLVLTWISWRRAGSGLAGVAERGRAGVAGVLGLAQLVTPDRVAVFSGLHAWISTRPSSRLVFPGERPHRHSGLHALSARPGCRPRASYYALMLSPPGGHADASADDLLSLSVGLETLSVCTYALCRILEAGPALHEGALKYLLMGSFPQAWCSTAWSWPLRFGGRPPASRHRRAVGMGPCRTRSPHGMVLLAAGFGFKIAAVPFHMYLPDMYERRAHAGVALHGRGDGAGGGGRPGSGSSSWVSRASRSIGAPVLGLAVLTMTIGTSWPSPRRTSSAMLAYSTSPHMGYILIGPVVGSPLGVAAVLFLQPGVRPHDDRRHSRWWCFSRMARSGETISTTSRVSRRRIPWPRPSCCCSCSRSPASRPRRVSWASSTLRRGGGGRILLAGYHRRRELGHLLLLLHAGGRWRCTCGRCRPAGSPPARRFALNHRAAPGSRRTLLLGIFPGPSWSLPGLAAVSAADRPSFAPTESRRPRLSAIDRRAPSA